MFLFTTKKNYRLEFKTLMEFCKWMEKTGIIYYHSNIYLYNNEILLEKPTPSSDSTCWSQGDLFQQVNYLLDDDEDKEEVEVQKINFYSLVEEEVQKMKYYSKGYNSINVDKILFFLNQNEFSFMNGNYKNGKFYHYSGSELLVEGSNLYQEGTYKIIDGVIYTLDKLANVASINDDGQLDILHLPYKPTMVDIGHTYNDFRIFYRSGDLCLDLNIEEKLNPFFVPAQEGNYILIESNKLQDWNKKMKKIAYNQYRQRKENNFKPERLYKTKKSKNPFDYCRTGDLIHQNHLGKLLAIKNNKPDLFFVDFHEKDLIVDKNNLQFINKGTNSLDSHYNFDFSFCLKIENQKIKVTKELINWLRYSMHFSFVDLFNLPKSRHIEISELEFSKNINWLNSNSWSANTSKTYDVNEYIATYTLESGEVIYFGATTCDDGYYYRSEASKQYSHCTDVLFYQEEKATMVSDGDENTEFSDSRFFTVSALFTSYQESLEVARLRAKEEDRVARVEKATRDGFISNGETYSKVKTAAHKKYSTITRLDGDFLIFEQKITNIADEFRLYLLDEEGFWRWTDKVEGGEITSETTEEIGKAKVWDISSDSYISSFNEKVEKTGSLGRESDLADQAFIIYPFDSSTYLHIRFSDIPRQVLTKSNKKNLYINGTAGCRWYSLKK